MTQFSSNYDLEERTAKFGENVIKLCKKEAQESKHWLRMLAVVAPELKEKIRVLWRECQELTMIFQKITSSL